MASGLEETLAWQLKAAGLTPEREYRFAPPRRYRADFAFLGARLLVEIDGGGWVGGRHGRGKGMESDAEKLNLGTKLGYRWLRFTGKHVRDGSALRLIEEVLKGA